MLRHAATRAAIASGRRRAPPVVRHLVSGTGPAQKKRPLNLGQLKGSKEGAGGASAATTPAAAATKPDPPAAAVAAEAAKPAAAAAAPGAGASAPPASSGASAASGKAAAAAAAAAAAPPASGGGGGGGGLILGVLALGLGVGAAYYYDVIDFESISGSPIKEEKKWEIMKQAKEDAEEAKLMEEVAKKEMAEAAAGEEATGESAGEGGGGGAEAADGAADAPETSQAAAATAAAEESAAKEDETSTDAASGSGNRVTTIHVPPADAERPAQVIPVPEHPADANRVTGLPAAAAQASTGAAEESAAEAAMRDAALISAEEAAKEISSTSEGETEAKLRAAHKSLRADLDEAYLADLDGLGERELRIRVVQLASEMDERTKWEAVRLKEFLSMKEKETAEKYLEVLQKQRVEFEDLLSRKLREQEDALTRKANAVIQAKDQSIQSVIGAAAEAQKAEHEAEIQSATERIERETKAKFEAELATTIAEEKAKFASELETRVSAMEQMAERLKNMEQALEVSRSFESGSIAAHKVSAAGLAFATKAESSKSAIEELAALKIAAGEDSVIGSALAKIPTSVKSGVPTLAELQAKFENVHSIGRQAALVPEGRTGVGGQLFGMAFAKMTIPPSPEALSEGMGAEDKSPEYVLARARRYVQVGDLESAVSELERLEGQAGFVMKDWRQSAMDRISLDKAVKVIKMECALMNKNMSGSA